MYNNTVPARAPPKSPSEPSISSSQSCPSSRDSSPVHQLFSAASSSPDIDRTCDTPDSQRQESTLAVMEHHNHPFDSPSSLRNKPRGVEAAGTTTSLSTSSHPRTSGFYNNSLPSPSASPAADSRHTGTIVPGNNIGGVFSNRTLTSANWRNTNIATSQNNNNNSSRSPFALPYQSNNDQAVAPAANQQYYHLSHNTSTTTPARSSPPSGLAPTMSSPVSASSQGNASTTSPTTAGTGQNITTNMATITTTDAGTNTTSSNNPGTDNHGSTMALVQISKALALTGIHTQQSQQSQQGNGGRAAGHTEMPFYAYCFDRGNGQYTRLIPADQLPPLVDIPPLQQGCLGMEVLECPRGLAPNGRSSNYERVFVQPTQQFGGQLTRRDPVQSRIDTIIASTPAPEPHKRQKIYCDKWIHEGVCAFTQQGCKYKHEMPLDKDTQESLGLFQGLPIWWRKHQGEITSDSLTSQREQLSNQLDGPPALPLSSGPGSGGAPLAGRSRGYSAGTGRGGFGGANRLRNNTWRSQGQTTTTQGGVGGRGPSASVSSGSVTPVGGGGAHRQQGQVAHFTSPFVSSFGPIAPPSVTAAKRDYEAAAAAAAHHNVNNQQPGSRNPYVDNNMWNVLKSEQGDSSPENGAKLG